MKIIEIRQGDAGLVPVAAYLNGAPLDIDDISEAEFTIGHDIRRTWPESAAFEDGLFFLPLSQEETFDMAPGLVPVEGRVRFRDGESWTKKCVNDLYLQVRRTESRVRL